MCGVDILKHCRCGVLYLAFLSLSLVTIYSVLQRTLCSIILPPIMMKFQKSAIKNRS